MESDASFVSARKGEEVADGAAMLESLMVQLEASWDSEEELEGGNRVGGKENVVRDEEEAEETEEELMFAVQEAKGWRWPVPPRWKGGKGVQESIGVEESVKVSLRSFFPLHSSLASSRPLRLRIERV